ncbi:MAG: hypothetical protein ACI841_001431 [Planctomycetota bacterium]
MHGMGVDVIQLDLSKAFTAARARNEGFKRLMKIAPNLQFVQFVDGDCEFEEGWLEIAESTLKQDAGLAVVCGRRRERFPHTTPYNRICDMEWDTPIGNAEACGGDAMFRISAFRQARGYNKTLIAGEEPELCFRLRQQGHRVLRVNAPMTIHDADMTTFRQFWLRAKRNGHALAEATAMHAEARHVHAVKSALLWGAFGMPMTALSLVLTLFALNSPEVDAFWIGPCWLLAAPYLYVRLFGRIVGYRIRHGDQPEFARLYARYTMIGKLAESTGIALFHWNQYRGRKGKLIEYKAASAGPSAAQTDQGSNARRRDSA